MFRALSESTIDGADRIPDFSGAGHDGDRINVSGLGFTALHEGAFTGSGVAELRVIDRGDGHAVVVGDADGDGARDLVIRLSGDAAVSADFIFAAPPSTTVHSTSLGFDLTPVEMVHPLGHLVLA